LTPSRIRGTKAAIIFAAFLVAGVGLASLIAMRSYREARSLIEADPPSTLLKHPETAGVAELQAISFVSVEGLHFAGWYVPSKNRAAVIITHGTNSDRASMLPEIRLLAEAGFGVLAFDWPGLGESEGPILWGAGARDALSAAIDWVSARAGVDGDRIGGLGFSIGGFVLTQVAATDRRLRAIALESTPSSFDAYIRVNYTRWRFLSEWPARWALRGSDLFSIDKSPIRLIGDISPRPLLIIGESDDPEIPSSMTQALFGAAREPKSLWFIRGAQHGGYAQVAGAEYAVRLRKFFTDNLLERDPP
jgi:dipeptidyl aminopeptidase/acylaminoacyl peptidase